MSWAEFIIRSIGFERKREFEMLMFRQVAYSSYVSGWMGKGRPPTIDRFWPIGKGKKAGPSDAQVEAFKRAREQYEEEVKRKKGG